MLTYRIIKSSKCHKCAAYLRALSLDTSITFETYDADLPANQKQLDEWRIVDMPVVQIIDESKTVKWQFPPGPFNSQRLRAKLAEIEKSR